MAARKALNARTLRAVARRLRRDLAVVKRTHNGSDTDDGYAMAVYAYAIFYEREARALTKPRRKAKAK
jgi:hypothetical protein